MPTIFAALAGAYAPCPGMSESPTPPGVGGGVGATCAGLILFDSLDDVAAVCANALEPPGARSPAPTHKATADSDARSPI